MVEMAIHSKKADIFIARGRGILIPALSLKKMNLTNDDEMLWAATWLQKASRRRQYREYIVQNQDELLWAAAWLQKASRRQQYREYIVRNQVILKAGDTIDEFGWDNKHVGINVLLSKVDSDRVTESGDIEETSAENDCEMEECAEKELKVETDQVGFKIETLRLNHLRDRASGTIWFLKSGSLTDVKKVHGKILKSGFENFDVIRSKLVDVYVAKNEFACVYKVLDEMPDRDLSFWNGVYFGLIGKKMMSGVVFGLFGRMLEGAVAPDELHSYATKAGMCADIIIEGSLLDLYVKCSDVQTAHEFFLTTEKENVVLWNVMLVAYGQLGDLQESFHIFSQMLIKGLQPNQYTYPSILRTCTLVGALDLGKQIHSQVVKTGFQPNVYVSSVLIDMYSKHGNLETAKKILRRLKERDVVSWTAMIAGYAQHDLFVEALKTFEEMIYQGIQSDNIGFSSAISACAGIQAINQGRQIHGQAVVCGYSSDLSIGNALVCLYARCGSINEAYLAFDKINLKDNVSWNALVSGFAQSGNYEESLKMCKYFIQMRSSEDCRACPKDLHRKHVEQDFASTVDYLPLPSSFLYPPMWDQNKLLIYSLWYMTEKENVVLWNVMLVAFGQLVDLRESFRIFSQMQIEGLRPNQYTYPSILRACTLVGALDLGEQIHSQVVKTGFQPNVYVSSVLIGNLEAAMKFLRRLKKRDVVSWTAMIAGYAQHDLFFQLQLVRVPEFKQLIKDAKFMVK
nr:hypothetical protein [Tanacetum cinerariifolium]